MNASNNGSPSKASTSATTATIGSSSSRPQPPQLQQQTQQQQHVEDMLPRTWRAVAHYLVLIASRAEKCAINNNNNNAAALEELNEATRHFLFNRLEWGKSISYLEAKIEGKAAEMESLQHYVRTQPTLGKSCKRKRKLLAVVVVAETDESSKLLKTIP